MHAVRVHHNFKIDTSCFEQGKRASQTRTLAMVMSLTVKATEVATTLSCAALDWRRCLLGLSYTEVDELSDV